MPAKEPHITRHEVGGKQEAGFGHSRAGMPNKGPTVPAKEPHINRKRALHDPQKRLLIATASLQPSETLPINQDWPGYKVRVEG